MDRDEGQIGAKIRNCVSYRGVAILPIFGTYETDSRDSFKLVMTRDTRSGATVV